VPAHRVDPGYVESEPPVQFEGAAAVAASHVQRDAAQRRAHPGDQVEKLAGSARVQAVIQRGGETSSRISGSCSPEANSSSMWPRMRSVGILGVAWV
jgi:hypothetical protein